MTYEDHINITEGNHLEEYRAWRVITYILSDPSCREGIFNNWIDEERVISTIEKWVPLVLHDLGYTNVFCQTLSLVNFIAARIGEIIYASNCYDFKYAVKTNDDGESYFAFTYKYVYIRPGVFNTFDSPTGLMCIGVPVNAAIYGDQLRNVQMRVTVKKDGFLLEYTVKGIQDDGQDS